MKQILCWNQQAMLPLAHRGSRTLRHFLLVKGTKSFAFWDMDLKLGIKKQETQKELLTLFPFLLKRFG